MTKGLQQLQVIELGGGVAASVAGKMVADLGARVVKIESPQGDETRRRGPFPQGKPDPEASGTFLFLNTNKRSLSLDLTGSGGRDPLDRLVGKADLLIHDFPPARMEAHGLEFERLAALNRSLVMLSITPFGLTGPYRDYAASDLTLFHAGGWGWICPGDSTPLSLPPGKPFGQHALIQAGLHGAVAALAACISSARTGIGEHIDMSIQEAVAFQLGRHTARYPYAGLSDSRDMPMPYEPFSFYPCRDGHIFIVCPEQAQWDRLVALMGHPDWCADERFGSREGREQHGKALKPLLAQWTARQEMEPLFHACQQVRVGAAAVFSPSMIERQEQLRARDFFVTQEHSSAGQIRLPGAPYLLREPWWRLNRSAPALGEANAELENLFAPRAGGAFTPHAGSATATSVQATGGPEGSDHLPPPLAGLRVLDFSWLWTGPHCTLMLAFLGAEVIKVESSRRPDLTRRVHIFPPEMERGLNRCGYFNQVGQGKKSITVDLSKPDGIDLVKRLAEKSDVMISNFSTGVMDRLGLGAEAMQRVNPDLIVATISAVGQSGPHKNYMGYGPLVNALSGLSAQTGYADGLPRDVGTAYGDPNGGVYAAIAILAALWSQRRHGGRGQVIDVSMWEAMICTAFEGWMNHALGHPPHRPMGNRDPVWAPHGVYRCLGEDAWVAIAVTDEAQWRALCEAMGEPAMARDPEWQNAEARKINEDELDRRITRWCADKDPWSVTSKLQAAGVPAFPSIDNRELLEDAHLNERGFFTRWPHPEVGLRTLVGSPWKLSIRANGQGSAAPLLGQHTDEVLEQVLGIDAGQRALYREQGVIE